MSILTKESTKNRKKSNKKKKKIKHQSLNTPFLIFTPDSKYFNNNDQEQRIKAHSMKKVIKIDSKFIIYDLLNKINRGFEDYLLKPLNNDNIMIGEKEKKVRLIRNLGILRW
jgi:hypothetical protein